MTIDTSESGVVGITLLSQNNSLQTGLLASLIGDNTGIPCVVAAAFGASDVADKFLLIDCHGQNLENLQAIVNGIQEHPDSPSAALLNAVAESEHEELLDWPCVCGVFFSDTDQDQLVRGLARLLKGEYWVPRRLLHHFLQKNRRAPSLKRLDIKLTKRERQILKLIKDGATNSDISDTLEVSEHTVKSHLYNVYKKIGVRNRLEASNWVRDLDDL